MAGLRKDGFVKGGGKTGRTNLEFKVLQFKHLARVAFPRVAFKAHGAYVVTGLRCCRYPVQKKEAYKYYYATPPPNCSPYPSTRNLLQPRPPRRRCWGGRRKRLAGHPCSSEKILRKNATKKMFNISDDPEYISNKRRPSHSSLPVFSRVVPAKAGHSSSSVFTRLQFEKNSSVVVIEEK